MSLGTGDQPCGSTTRLADKTRRTFLKLMGSASVAAASLAAQTTGGKPRTAKTESPGALDKLTNVDVVVIGGGFAGITAARECCKAGLRTVLLEARNRLGGRTFYSKFGDEPVELGGAYIHWFQPNIWSEVLHYGLPVMEPPGITTPQKFMWLSGGKLQEPPLDQALTMFSDGMKKFNVDAAKIFPRPYDNVYQPDLVNKYAGLSIMDRIEQINLPAEQADVVQGMMELCASSSVRQAAYLDMAKWWALSGNDLFLMDDALARYKFEHGTISLINAMVEDAKIPVFMSAPVTKVKQGVNAVDVTLQNGKVIKAKRVIVAVPLNVLQYIQFEPSLSAAKLAASKEKHSGSGVMVYMRVKGQIPAFWALAHEPEPLSALWMERASERDSLICATGSSPDLLDIHDTAQVQRALRKFFPDAVVEETMGYDWHLDPYSRGTWCVYRPNQLTRYWAELRKPEGNIYFASSDWASGWRGFMDGAVESGRHFGQLAVRSFAA